MASTVDGSPLQPDEPGPVAEAERIVREVEARWDHLEGDLDRLLDQATATLADHANHELRQILAQVGTEAELLSRSVTDQSAHERVDRILRAVERATAIVGSHLDRHEIAKLMIRLDRDDVDLATMVEDSIRRAAIDPSRVDADVRTSLIEGDRKKLGAALDHLVQRFAFEAQPGQRLHIRLRPVEAHVEGSIGLDPAPDLGHVLIRDLEEPLEISEAGVDLPYARTVIERHGGALYVDRFGEGRGYGFRLPKKAGGRIP